MGKGDGVQELALNQRVLRVDVKVDIDHGVEYDNQAEDDQIRSNAFCTSDEVDCAYRDQELENFNVEGADGVGRWAS